MKPLAHWAIHRQFKIQLGGRSVTELWGRLVDSQGQATMFRYERHTRRLILGAGDTARTVQLDEYGFEQPRGPDG
jgi:hypothetical protein